MSVVLPCYRAAPLAFRSVERLEAFLPLVASSWEIVVVDDGGHDFPDDAFAHESTVRLIRFPSNRGKGAAVSHGMRLATGAVRVFTDIDLPYDLELIGPIIRYIRDGGFHVVVGDRTLPGSSYKDDIGWKRRLASSVFSAFVGTMVTGGFFDTQCGLKGIRGDVADTLFALQRLERFAFDVEVIYLALYHRLDIKRIPVRLRNNETSSVRILRDSARSVVDIFRIKYHQLHGDYESATLATLVTEEFAEVQRSGSGRGP